MIGLVLVAHGNLAHEFLNVLNHVAGAAPAQVKAVGMEADEDMDAKREEILQAIDAVNTGDGVMVLTDMFGGTPSNLAISMIDQKNIEVLAGMNIPMLVKANSVRDKMPLNQAVLQAKEAARKYINVASELLSEGAAR
jgi:mannose PTS system EIIA component